MNVLKHENYISETSDDSTSKFDKRKKSGMGPEEET